MVNPKARIDKEICGVRAETIAKERDVLLESEGNAAPEYVEFHSGL
jgi:hypothetical protein